MITFLILAVSNILIALFVKKSKKVNKEITNEDLERLHIEPDMENTSNEEIENMFK